MELFQVQPSELDTVLAELRSGRIVEIRSGRARDAFLRPLTTSLGDEAILVHLPRDLDATPYVALSIAAQCAPSVMQQTAGLLADREAAAAAWQDVLSSAMAGRPLLVEGLDAWTPPEWDASGVLAPAFAALSTWLRQAAALRVSPGSRVVEISPRVDARFETVRLWERVAHDAELYALAVARELLLGPLPAEVRCDEETLLGDLWGGMPSDMRDLVAFLAVHGRPVPRGLFERLSLVSPGTIDRAADLALVEVRRGQLSLPAPWYARTAWLDPARRHRRLGDAFAEASGRGSGVADPLAVLEAHRHYATIPDHERALSFADFGASALLETAVRQSLERKRAEAAKTYEALLTLDERIVSAQRVEGLGKRTRAYVRHYLHYNRYLANPAEPLAETIAGYRRSLADWPEHALFWSRLVRALFAVEDETGALLALEEAYLAVPLHAHRDQTLIARTADRLLRRDRVLAAVFVWGEHRSGDGFEREVEAQLARRLADGFSTRRLWARGLRPVDVDREIAFRAVATEGGAECSTASIVRQRATQVAAVRAAVLAAAFDALASRWRQETGGLSIASARYQHPAMKQILAMGREVVPEILHRVEGEPDHWHFALTTLTGESPFSPGEKVKVTEACARWVSWGRAHGFSW